MQDLCPIGGEEEYFFKHSDPADPEFPCSRLIDWQLVRDNLQNDAQKYLKNMVKTPRSCWAINHVLIGDVFNWQNERPLIDLSFRVLALHKNEQIPWHHKSTEGRLLYDSSSCPWWPTFTQSLRNIDIKHEDAPMYGGEWESYFEVVYRAQVLSSLGSTCDQLGLFRDASVSLGQWPPTGNSISDMIAPNGQLHLLMNFDGETAEEVLNHVYGYNQFAPNKAF